MQYQWDANAEQRGLSGQSASDGQELLDQICATIDTIVQPQNVLREYEMRVQRLPTGANLHPMPNGHADLTINIGDLVLMPYNEGDLMTPAPMPGAPRVDPLRDYVKSAFSAFNGKPLQLTPAEYRARYKFLGLARSQIIFDPTIKQKLLDVAASGVVNWTNYTKDTVQPGVPMTWSVNAIRPAGDPIEPVLKQNANPSHIVKAIFVPALPVIPTTVAVPTGVVADPNAAYTEGYRMGVTSALLYTTSIVGKNGGKPVKPGAIGQIILD